MRGLLCPVRGGAGGVILLLEILGRTAVSFGSSPSSRAVASRPDRRSRSLRSQFLVPWLTRSGTREVMIDGECISRTDT